MIDHIGIKITGENTKLAKKIVEKARKYLQEKKMNSGFDYSLQFIADLQRLGIEIPAHKTNTTL